MPTNGRELDHAAFALDASAHTSSRNRQGASRGSASPGHPPNSLCRQAQSAAPTAPCDRTSDGRDAAARISTVAPVECPMAKIGGGQSGKTISRMKVSRSVSYLRSRGHSPCAGRSRRAPTNPGRANPATRRRSLARGDHAQSRNIFRSIRCGPEKCTPCRAGRPEAASAQSATPRRRVSLMSPVT